MDSATKLLNLLAPTMAAGVARASPGGLSASRLMSLLGDQRDTVRRHAPPGLAALLGLADRPTAYASSTTVPPTRRGNIWPWVVGLGIGALLLLFGLNMCARREAVLPTTPAPAPRVAPVEPRAAVPPARESTAMEQLRFPDGTTITVIPGSINAELHRFLTSNEATPKTFVFDRLNFETGTAALTPASNPTVDSMASILRAYPAVTVRLEGYTDDQGDLEPNQALSEARARRVADMLIARGVDVARIETVGYGETRPVASNDTEAGRAQNRRIELVVTRK
jgi:outer membrane protein OmpA-like peptidoglycan-associated protein